MGLLWLYKPLSLSAKISSTRSVLKSQSRIRTRTMNPMKVLSLLAFLAVAALGKPNNRMDNSVSQALKPSQWLSGSQLEAIPAVDDLTLERLESMSLEKGAELVQQICK